MKDRMVYALTFLAPVFIVADGKKKAKFSLEGGVFPTYSDGELAIVVDEQKKLLDEAGARYELHFAWNESRFVAAVKALKGGRK